MSLEIYTQYGFEFFLCNADKTPDISSGHKDETGKWVPDSWKDGKYHLTREEAEAYQNQGRMIGAWIPEDVLVLDLDRHEGKPDGVETFNRIKEKYNVEKIAFQEDTYCVRTKSGGFHVFFTAKGHQFTQGTKDAGIDLKTHAGYVIAAGSPGYIALSDAEPMPLPDTLAQWLENCQQKTKAGGKQGKKKAKSDLLPVSQLKRILKKIDITRFRGNERWQRFVTSCIAAAGDTPEVYAAVDEWSKGDPEYSEDRSVAKRIESFQQDGGITIGSFIAYLQEEDVSDHIIKRVIRLDKMNLFLVEAERREIKLPFVDPDYQELSYLSEAGAFYNFQGNSSAAVLLADALKGKMIFVEGEEKRYFYFDGNRWNRLSDIYQVIYTVLYRIAKHKHAEKENSNAEGIGAVLAALNSTQWKANTAKELSVKAGIFHESVRWDSVEIKETVTAKDGVIDFSTREIKTRKGRPEEFRRSHVPYSLEEIIEAKKPKKYLDFLGDIFPEKETCRTARLASSLCISGNANWRTFQIWVGEGSNGKSTWIEVLKKTLGEEKAKNYEVRILLERKFESLGTTPELAHFEGAYAMFGIEVDPGKRFQSGIIKNLTGGDDITINPKYQHERDIKATWQLIFACNDLPTFDGNDPAMINRMVILPFRMRYYKDNDDLEEIRRKGVDESLIKKAGDRDQLIGEMLKERACIIRLLIDDYIELVTKHDGAIPQSDECKREKLNYREQNDIIGEFVRSLCEIDENRPDFFEPLNDLASAYSEFAGIKTVSSTFIVRQLMKYDKRLEKTTQRISRDGKSTNARGLQYIRLRDFETEPAAKAGAGEEVRHWDESKHEKQIDDQIPF